MSAFSSLDQTLGRRIEKEIVNSKTPFNQSYCFRFIRNLLFENGEGVHRSLFHDHKIFDLINPRLKVETHSKVLFEITYIVGQFTSALLLDEDLFDRDLANEITDVMTTITMKKLIHLLPVDYPAVRHNIVIAFGNFATVSTELRNYLLFEGIVPHFIDNCLRRRWGTKRRHIRTNSWFVSLLVYHENNQVDIVKPFLPFIRLCLHDKDHVIKNYALQCIYNFTCGLKVEWVSEILKFGFIRRISELCYINIDRCTRPLSSGKNRRRGVLGRISEMENNIVYYSFSILVNLLFFQSEESSSSSLEILSNGFFKRVYSYILTNNSDLLNDEEKMTDILSSLAHLTSVPTSPTFINQMIDEGVYLRAFQLIGLCSSKVVRSQCVEVCCRFIYSCDMFQYERVNQQLRTSTAERKEENGEKKRPMIVLLLVTRVLRKFDSFETYAVDSCLDVLVRIIKYEKDEGGGEQYESIRGIVRKYGILEILDTLQETRKMLKNYQHQEEEEGEGGENERIDDLRRLV